VKGIFIMPRSRDLLSNFSKRLDIPREALPGGFGLTLSGESELTVRGCKRILSYGSELICLRVGKTRLFVRGKGLFCTSFGAGCVTVSGRIMSLALGEEPT